MNRERVRLCGVSIDTVDLPGAVRTVLRWAVEPERRCRVVVTPNVHHVVLVHEQPALKAVYDHADLVLVDGAPLVALSRGVGRPLPGRVAGSDLVPALLGAAPAGLRVFLHGAAPGVGGRAAAAIATHWPGVVVAGVASPPPGFEDDPDHNDALVAAINAARPDLLVIGLGAPKQELWVHRHADRLDVAVALCVGATIDFLAGHVRRAPEWVQRVGLEWLYRVGREPSRLFGRYLHDGRVFVLFALLELCTQRRPERRAPRRPERRPERRTVPARAGRSNPAERPALAARTPLPGTAEQPPV